MRDRLPPYSTNTSSLRTALQSHPTAPLRVEGGSRVDAGPLGITGLRIGFGSRIGLMARVVAIGLSLVVRHYLTWSRGRSVRTDTSGEAVPGHCPGGKSVEAARPACASKPATRSLRTPT